MIRGVTFDKQLMSSADHAHEVNYYFGGDVGITKGCNVVENVSGDLVISDGFFVIKGRLVNVIGTEIVAVPSVASGTLYSILVFEIDLTQVNTTTTFNQGAFKIISNASTYPTLTQQDLDDGGDIYQLEFARFENSISGIANLTDTRVLLEMSKYMTKSNPVATGLIDLQSGQIKFPSVPISSSDPNTLDDYKEGTWTPVINFDGNAVGVTYFSQKGIFSKIGNRVTLDGTITLTNKGSSVGALRIGGLPYPIKNITGLFSVQPCQTIGLSSLMQTALQVNYETLLVNLMKLGEDVGITNTLATNNTQIRFHLEYTTN